MLVLIWPLVLDPRRKLDYFRAAGWEEEWIEAAREIVREEFDRGYAGIRLENEDDSEELSSVCHCIIISIISD
jgi:hypothetical protein